MKEFWKNEWQLFLNDMQELGEFCLQPVEITGVPWKKSAALKPSVEEIEQKCDQVGFWQNGIYLSKIYKMLRIFLCNQLNLNSYDMDLDFF